MARTKHRIGRFRVIAPIGAGGFSTVYRALDEENNREVAIKVLAENHSMVPETRRRFIDEFNLRSTVSSPFIAKMYEVGIMEDSGQPYMVLELASRGDLRRRVEEIRRSYQVLNRADLMMLSRHLTEALTALHDADIVHRDVSPGNILIRSHPKSGARQGSLQQGNVTLLEPGERFLLADLGNAKDLVRSSGFTAGGGTQGYAAPEQRDDVTVVDHRADIFSATAIIEWAAVDGPFADDLEPFCDVGLASEPDERFADMAEWYDAISDALDVERDRPGRSRRRGRSRRGGRSVDDSGSNPTGDRAGGGADSTGNEPRFEAGPGSGGRPGGKGGDGGEGAADAPTSQRAGPILLAAGALLIAAGAIIGSLVTTGRLGSPGGDGGRAGSGSGTTITTGSSAIGDAEDAEDVLVVDTKPRPENDEPGSRPWANVESPLEQATIEADLLVAGEAKSGTGPVDHVELRICNQTTGLCWIPDRGFVIDDTAFPVEISEYLVDDRTKGRFAFALPAEWLEPGQYFIEIWSIGPDGTSSVEPAKRTVVVA